MVDSNLKAPARSNGSCSHQWTQPGPDDVYVCCEGCRRHISIERLARDLDAWAHLLGDISRDREQRFTEAVALAVMRHQDRLLARARP